ncbi:UNKNOWN [Stylonychia lemnae]|uniref:Uncharacterized protein n=1 Tax=Stylonychia lemnae TaxID=5949 RepID=A0A078ANT6_STYLE|nr:UNKNOWN [Stylonychia lemnae]|eukprot:CDW84015.1 UNKNOWN [Stylonychia lemnae]
MSQQQELSSSFKKKQFKEDLDDEQVNSVGGSLNLEIQKIYDSQMQNNRYRAGSNLGISDKQSMIKDKIKIVQEQIDSDEEEDEIDQENQKDLRKYESQKNLHSSGNLDSNQFYVVKNRGSVKNLQQIKAYTGGNNALHINKRRLMSAKRPNNATNSGHAQTSKVLEQYNAEDIMLQNALGIAGSKTFQNPSQIRNAIQSVKNNQKILFEKAALANGQYSKVKSQKRQLQFYEKEQLQEECLTLKDQINDCKEYNIILRNQKQFLQTEIQKRDKIIENLNQALFQSQMQLRQATNGSVVSNNMGSSFNKSALFSPNLALNLKRQIQDLQGQMEMKDQELDYTRKKIKFTKIAELEIELETHKEHAMRLSQIVNYQQKKLLEKQSTIDNNLTSQVKNTQGDSNGHQQQEKTSARKLNRINSAKERFISPSSVSLFNGQSSIFRNNDSQTRIATDLTLRVQKQDDLIKRLKAQLEVQKRLVSDKKVENDAIRRNQSEQMDNTRKLIETLSINNLRSSIQDLQSQIVKSQTTSPSKLDEENRSPRRDIEKEQEVMNQKLSQHISEKYELIIQQLQKENELLKRNEDINNQERVRMLELEKNLKNQFADIKSKLDKFQSSQNTKDKSSDKVKEQLIDNQKHQIAKLEQENAELKKDKDKFQKFIDGKDKKIEEQENKLKIAIQQVEDLKSEIQRIQSLQEQNPNNQQLKVEDPNKKPKKRVSIQEQASSKQIDDLQKHDFKGQSSLKKKSTSESTGAGMNKQGTAGSTSKQPIQLGSLFTIMSRDDDEQDNKSDDYSKDQDELKQEKEKIQPLPKIDSDDDDDFKANSNKLNAEEGILKIAFYLQKNGLSLRNVFQDYVFDDSIDDKEFELIAIREFSDLVKTTMSLEEKHVQAISIMLADHFIGDSFNFQFFEEIFKQMGFVAKEEKLQALDNKSKRILNRLSGTLKAKNNTSLKDLFSDSIQIQKVKIKDKGLVDVSKLPRSIIINDFIQVEVIESKIFFQKIQKIGVRISDEPYPNLQENFIIHKNMPNLLVLKKIQNIIDDMDKSNTVQRCGTIVSNSTLMSILQKRKQSNAKMDSLAQDAKSKSLRKSKTTVIGQNKMPLSPIKSQSDDESGSSFEFNQGAANAEQAQEEAKTQKITTDSQKHAVSKQESDLAIRKQGTLKNNLMLQEQIDENFSLGTSKSPLYESDYQRI